MSKKSSRRVSRVPRIGRRLRGWWSLIAFGVAAVVVVVGLVVAQNMTSGSKEIPALTASAQGRILGSADAPVTVIEYSDFQCPVCARAAREIRPEMEERYINPGLVKLEYRHFAFIGQESVWAAEASECAREQDRFWDYHDELFSNQQGENRGAFSLANLKGFAADLGLDSAKFDACLDSHQYASAVQQETDEARRADVESTPTFFIGDTVIRGVTRFGAFDPFQEVIEKELSAQ